MLFIPLPRPSMHVSNLPASKLAMLPSIHLKEKSSPPNMPVDGGRLCCSFIKPLSNEYVLPHWPPSWLDAVDFSPPKARTSKALLDTISVEFIPGLCASSRRLSFGKQKAHLVGVKRRTGG